MTYSDNKPAAYKEYISRINQVQDYIEENLAGNLALDILSEISGFSKFHFHRIFSAIVKETLLSYINRVRMERAVSMLIHNPSMSITEIGMKLGFSESSVFSRLFKKYYGMSASTFRKNNSKNGQVNSKNGQYNDIMSIYNTNITKETGKEDVMLVKGNIEVKMIEEIKAIYLRLLGSYENLALQFPKMMARLFQWAMARNLLDNNSRPFAIYHDNPEFTEPDHLKTSICLVVTQDASVDGDIGKIEIPSGKYAIGHFEVDKPSDHTQAWDYIYGQWLPNSGFQPADGYVFEMYMNDPHTHPEKKHFIDIYLPVKPL